MSLESPLRFRRAALVGLMASALLFLSGCSTEQEDEFKRLAMPVGVTKEAPFTQNLWDGAWIAALLTGVVVWGLIIFVVVRYRRRSESEIPIQTRYNLPIEIFYTIAPIMMVIVFFYFTLDTQKKVLHTDKNPDQTVTVVGQQWSWTFNYNLGYDEAKGAYAPVDGKQVVYDVGTTSDRPVLWLVKDKSVTFDLESPDVIHSFWVPNFLFKMDVVPGRHNHFTLTPTTKGHFVGRCSELCGVYHSRMLFDVNVVDQAAYDAHMKDLAERGNTGPALGSADTRTVPGLKSDDIPGGEE